MAKAKSTPVKSRIAPKPRKAPLPRRLAVKGVPDAAPTSCFQFPSRRPDENSAIAPRVERRAVPRPQTAAEILDGKVLASPLDAATLAKRRVDQLSTTWYTVESFIGEPGGAALGVVLRWNKDLEIWRRVDVPRKGYAIAISDFQVEYVSKYSVDDAEALAAAELDAKAMAAMEDDDSLDLSTLPDDEDEVVAFQAEKAV